LVNKNIGDWGLGIGDWGLGIGDWAQSPIPNPQSPIPIYKMNFNIIKIKKKFLIIVFILIKKNPNHIYNFIILVIMN